MQAFIKILTAFLLVFVIGETKAQNGKISNTGKEFWVGYGHHQYMETPTDNSQNMVLYLSAGKNPATVTITLDSSNANPALWFKRVYNIPANSIITTECMPKGTVNANCGTGNNTNYDARLLLTLPIVGKVREGIFRGKGIHIESTEPIVAYAHIYGGVSSGATMLLPVETWGYSYTSINSNQVDAQLSYSWLYVVANHDSTLLEITPSQPSSTTPPKPKNVAFQVMLMKGQIYQLAGQADAAGNGVQLTGSKVKSIANAHGKCYPVAVFSGSSRTGGEPCPTGTAGRDNDMQQCFPQQAWGKRYLLAPMSTSAGAANFQTNVYKIVDKDPATKVYRNGVRIFKPGGLSYYRFLSNTADYIEADKPIAVAQFMASGGGGCYSGDGDPEMVFLSAIEQGISNITFMRNNKEAINSNYLTLIIPDGGLASLKIDGVGQSSNYGSNSNVYPHPNKPGYSVVSKGWPSPPTVPLQATAVCNDSFPFTAITYGLGGAESYGFNAGTYVDNLSAIEDSHNPADTTDNLHTNPFSFVFTPRQIGAKVAYKPKRMIWRFDQIANKAGTSLVSYVTPNTAVTVDYQITYNYNNAKSSLYLNAGGFPAYSWFRNGINQSTGLSYLILDSITNGDIVFDSLTSSASCIINPKTKSPDIAMTMDSGIVPKVSITASAANIANATRVCSKTKITFAAYLVNGGPTPTYEWWLNNKVIFTGTTKDTLQIDSLKNGDSIKCRLYSDACWLSVPWGESPYIVIHVADTAFPKITIVPTATSLCASSTIISNAYISNGGITPVYQWSVNGVNVGTNSNVYSSNTLNALDTVRCKLTSNAGCLATPIAIDSFIVTNTANVAPAIKIVVQDTAICPSVNAPVWAIPSNGGPTPHYQWMVNGINVGTDNDTLNTSTLVPALKNKDTITCVLTTSLTTCNSANTGVSNKIVMTVAPKYLPESKIVASSTSFFAGNYIKKTTVPTTYYTYRLPGLYTFSKADTFYMPLEIYSSDPDVGDCNNVEIVPVRIIVKEKPMVDSLTPRFAQPSCGKDTIQIFSKDSTGNKYPYKYKIIKWLWTFPDGTTDSVRNPKHFLDTGRVCIGLRNTVEDGGVVDTTICIYVAPKPKPNFTALPSSVCLGTPIKFCDSTVYSGLTPISNWYWDFSQGPPVNAGNGNCITINYPNVGNYQVCHAVYVSTSCKSDTLCKIVKVLSHAIVSFALPSGCLPASGIAQFNADSVTAGGEKIATYLWDFGDAASGANNTSTQQNPTHLFVGAGPTFTMKLSITTPSGCSGDTTFTVTPKPSPTASLPALTNLCVNAAAVQLPAGGSTGTGPVCTSFQYIGTGTSSTGLFDPAISGVGTYNIKYVCTAANGCTDTATRPITVYAKPTVPAITGDSSVCKGDTATLYNTTAGGVWTSASTGIATISNTGFIKGISDGTSTIKYKVTNTNNCSDSISTTVTVFALPVMLPITGPDKVCEGKNITLTTATTGSVFYYSSDPSIASIDLNSGYVTGNVQGAVVISAIANNTNGCIDSVHFNLTVNPPPAMSATTGVDTICMGQTSQLANPTPLGTGTGRWKSIDTTIAKIDSITGLMTGVGAGTTTIWYTVDKGCVDSISNSVTILLAPTVANITGANAICINKTTDLAITTTGGVWASSNTSVASFVIGANPQTITVTGVSVGTSTITYTVSNGVCSTVGTLLFTVNDKPTVTPITGNTSLCIGTTSQLTSTPVANGTWKSLNTAVATVDATGLVTAVAAGTAIIRYIVNNGCVDSAQTTVTVYALPVVASITGNATVCAGKTSTLSNTTAGGTWVSTDASIATVDNAGLITGISGGNCSVRYIVSGANACKDSASINVIVNALPVVAAITGDTTICFGKTSQLSNTTSGGNWTSTNAAVASINATGLISGISAGTATIRYIVTNAQNCTDSISTLVTVNPLPIIAAITGNTSLCAGKTEQLSNTTAGGVWSSTNILVATINNTGLISGVAAGNTTIWFVVDNGCQDSVSISVKVNGLPIISPIAGVPNICLGKTTKFEDITPGGVWSSDNVLVATIDNLGNITTVAAGTTTIRYKVTNLNGCLDSVSASLSVNPLPVVSAITGNTVICVGTSSQLSNATPAGAWTSTNQTVAFVNNAGLFSGIATGASIIRYTVITANGCVDSVSTNVTVNKPPVIAAIAGNASICAGKTSQLSNNTPNGTWSSTNTTVATIDPVTGFVNAITAGTTTIRYVVSNGCLDSVSKIIVINALPVIAPITGASTVCFGKTTKLSNTTPGGVWTSSDPTIASINNLTGLVKGISNGTVRISYVVTNFSGCVDSGSTQITVNSLPVISPITGATSLCVGDTNNLSCTPAGGTWVSTKPNIASIDAYGFIAGISGGSTIVRYIVDNGCVDSVATIVTVNPLPIIAPISGATSLCVGKTATLSTIPNTGTWSSSDTTIATINSSGSWTAVAYGTSNILYVVTTAAGCIDSVSKQVQAHPLPLANFNVPQFVCMPKGLAYFTNTSNVVDNSKLTYIWDVGTGPNNPTTKPDTSVVYPDNTTSVTVRLIATSAFGCSDDTTQTFTKFYAKPTASINVNKDTLCQGTPSLFSGTGVAPNSNVLSWIWDFGDNSLTQNGQYMSQTFSNPGTYTVSLYITNQEGCKSDVVTKPVLVYRQPVITAGPGFIVPVGTLVQFMPITNDSFWSFSWTPPTGLSHPDSLNPKLTATHNQIYTLTATGAGSCSSSDTLSVKVLLPLVTPNAFSPNGDGVNDTWVIENLKDYPGCTVDIFNEYGQKVFHSDGYPKPWNGTLNGQALPVATYYFIINPKNGFPVSAGPVTIIR